MDYEDYIHTYTWDKKLESWVKELVFLGGAGKGELTIVTPCQYRQRFVSAMEHYFLLVSDMFSGYELLIEYAFQIPDRWMKQIDTMEEEITNTILSDL